ncbi:MAG: 6-bladed beta-propeller [Bacteroidales bacterium]|nr:6-bladed beta-propeller [Bacteroidales bacterium]
MKKLIILFIIAITSCQNNSGNQPKDLRIIDVEGGVGKGRLVKLSEIAESIEYIPLETNSEAVVGKIFFERIIYEKDCFYFMERSRSIIIYDKSGKYFNRINRYGRGPQEYETAFDMDVDIITGNILIVGMNKIIEYSINGDFIRIVNFRNNTLLNDQFITKVQKIDNKYFLLARISKITKHSGFIIDSASNIIKSIFYPESQYEIYLRNPDLIMLPTSFMFKDTVRLIKGYNQEILRINKKFEVDTAFILNYGKYTADLNNMNHLLSRAPYIWSRFKIFESDQYLFMFFHVGPLADKPAKMIGMRGNQYDYQHDCSFFNKRTGEFQFIHQPEINQLGFVEDFEGGPAVWPKYVSSDGYLITYLYAHEFKAHAETHEVSERFKQIAHSLKDTDNPVIVRVKLKN